MMFDSYVRRIVSRSQQAHAGVDGGDQQKTTCIWYVYVYIIHSHIYILCYVMLYYVMLYYNIIYIYHIYAHTRTHTHTLSNVYKKHIYIYIHMSTAQSLMAAPQPPGPRRLYGCHRGAGGHAALVFHPRERGRRHFAVEQDASLVGDLRDLWDSGWGNDGIPSGYD